MPNPLEALGISPFEETPAPPPPPPPPSPPPPRRWPWMPRRQHPQPLQVRHAHSTGATFQFHQADHARRRAHQRYSARSTNRAYEAAFAELRLHQAKLKAAEEACARKDEMLARQRREAAEHEAAMQRRHTLNSEAHARRGVLIRMLY